MVTVQQYHCARRRDFSQRPGREILNPFRGIKRKIWCEPEQSGGALRQIVRTVNSAGQIGARLTKASDSLDLLCELSRGDHSTCRHGKAGCFQCLRHPGVAGVNQAKLAGRRIKTAVAV